MAKLDFDFHDGPRRPHRLGLVLALAGAIALGAAWNRWDSVRAADAGLALQVASLESRPLPRPHRATAQDEGLARVTTQLAYRWQPAFDALMAARSDKIALVSLDAVQAKSQVKLVAEARELADAVAFVDALQRQPGVTRAALYQHEVQAGAAQHPVRFTVVVDLSA